MKIFLDAVRVNAGMTNAEWARELGVTSATVTNWESGATKPNLEQIRRMSELSGIPMDYIFSRTTKPIKLD